ncbi:MAG: ATP-dependent DNA helicase [Patescibacteria group bacterium]|jgi:DNA helicase-2/ATP-dependent DNA helicase PcrA
MFNEDYLKLNSEQKKAVDHIDGPMLVLAGAGTGKTQIIALRIAKLLLETQLDPQNILCLTFTETGAAAMRQRLISMIGEAAYYVSISTFHGFCNNVIQSHAEHFLFTHELEPLTDVERVTVMCDVLDTLEVNNPLKPFGAPYFYLHPLLSVIQTLKRENITVERYEQIIQKQENNFSEMQAEVTDFINLNARKLSLSNCLAIQERINQPVISKLFQRYCSGDEPQIAKFKQGVKRWLEQQQHQLPRQRAVIEVYKRYQEQLKTTGWYDYEDMLLFVVKAFEEHDDLLAEYQERYQYILVDEYQDTNGAQNRIVELLGSFFEQPNVFSVGDDRQSIYRFQGASLENILSFLERYPQAEVISLKQNYRSQQTILDAAYDVINHNQHSIQHSIPNIEQRLIAATKHPAAPVQLGMFSSAHTERYWIAKQIQKLITEEQIAPADIAVIYRNNRDANELMDMLTACNVPYQLEAGVDILHDLLIQQIILLLRYIAAPAHNEMLFNILHFTWLDFLPLDIIKMLSDKEHKLLELVTQPELLKELQLEQFKKLEKFGQNLLRWRQYSLNNSFARLLEVVLDESGLLKHVLAQPDKLEQLNRINTLLNEGRRLQQMQHDFNLSEFFDHLALLREHGLTITEEALPTRNTAVHLLTAHKAKGLEFAHVFIMHCVDQHWGNVISRRPLALPAGIIKHDVTSGEDNNEDERRLFYVAMTRAKQQLYLTYAAKNNNSKALTPALFVAELNAKHIKQIDTTIFEEQALERLETILLKQPALNHAQAERDYLTAKLKNYSLSPSHLNDYLTCPLLFYYQDVLRVPQQTGRAVGYGIAMHSTLEEAVAYFLREQQAPKLTLLLDRFTFHLQRQNLSKKDYQESLDFGLAELTQYYEANRERFSRKSLVENRFTAEINGVPINGKIDKIELTEDGNSAHVIDYKTGNPDNKSGKLAKGGDYERQLLFYKLLCEKTKSFKPNVASGEIHFIQRSKKTDTYPHRRYELTNEAVVALGVQIKQVYTDIQNLKFLSAKPEEYCGECRYCEMFNV